jgi:acyl-CoA synthetase (AMP-forming)/AMP-acid ligase II
MKVIERRRAELEKAYQTWQHLATFTVPRGVELVRSSDLPITSTGKVQKYRLVAGLPR